MVALSTLLNSFDGHLQVMREPGSRLLGEIGGKHFHRVLGNALRFLRRLNRRKEWRMGEWNVIFLRDIHSRSTVLGYRFLIGF